MRHISCGALNAYIVYGDNPDATAVAAQIGYGEPWCFLAFGQVPVDRLVAVDQTRFIALTAVRDGNPKWMAMFDAEERKQIGPTVEVSDLSAGSRMLVTRERDRVIHLNASSCRCWSLPGFAEMWTREFPDLTIDDTAERDDGWVIVKASRSAAHPAEFPLVLALSPDGLQVEAYDATPEQGSRPDPDRRRSAFKLSAGGRWLERAHDGAVLATDKRGVPIPDLARLADIDDERLVDAIKSVWIHGVREIWSAAPIQFHSRLVVRSMSLYDALTEKPSLEAIHAQQRMQAAQQRLLDLEKEGPAAEESDAVRAEIARLRNLQNDFIRARAALRWLVRFADIAPYDAWQPGDPAFFDRLPSPETRWVKQQFLQPLDVARGEIESWDAGDQAFVMRFPDGWRRKVALDGELGEPEPAAPEETPAPNGVPADIKAAAGRFLRAVSVPTIRLGRLDEYNCVRAIEEIITRLRSGMHKVVWGRQLTLRFALPDGELNERQFFDFVGANCEHAVVSIRHLLAAYDEGAKSNDVWSDDGVSALGYAALALARLDPEAHVALEGYFRRRNPREDVFGTQQLLPALAEHTNSFGNLGALRFALLRLPEEETEARAGHMLAPLILSGARACLSPAAFLKEVERTARSIMWRSEIETWALAGNVSMKDVKHRMAAAAERVHDGLLAPLIRAADPLEDWDFAFIAAARRKRSHYPQSALRWFEAWRRIRRLKSARPAATPTPARPQRDRQGRNRARDLTKARRGGALPPTRTAEHARDEEKIAR